MEQVTRANATDGYVQVWHTLLSERDTDDSEYCPSDHDEGDDSDDVPFSKARSKARLPKRSTKVCLCVSGFAVALLSNSLSPPSLRVCVCVCVCACVRVCVFAAV